jgi:methyl-accepting chemotaxis protein
MEVLVPRLTVRSRIIASFGLLLAILVGSNALALQRLSALEDAERHTTEQVVPYVNDLQSAALSAKGMANDERGFLLSGDAKFAAEVEERKGKVHEALDRAARIDGGKHAGDVGQIRAPFDAWTDALRAEFTLFATDEDAARARALGANRDLRKTYEQQFTAALDRAITAQNTSSDAAKRAADNGRRLVLLLLALAAFVAVVVGAWLLRSVQKPIDEAVDVLSRAADGDLVGRLESRSDDEFGVVAESVNRLLQQTATVVGAMSGTAARLRESSDELRVTSDGLGVAADGTASVADSAAASAQQVSASVDTVAAATEEMGASIREIARSAEEASSVAREAVTAASDADATVARLGQSSSEINDVVALITSIAGQTNLLALNATIEAGPCR